MRRFDSTGNRLGQNVEGRRCFEWRRLPRDLPEFFFTLAKLFVKQSAGVVPDLVAVAHAESEIWGQMFFLLRFLKVNFAFKKLEQH